MTQRNYLFIHQNMPAQFMHLCMYLRDRGHKIVFITQNNVNRLAGVTNLIYKATRPPLDGQHPYLKDFEEGVLNGQGVFRGITRLKQDGFQPDVVIGHCGWGEMFFVKDALPNVPILNYFEYFYRSKGQDVGFDPEYPSNVDAELKLRIRNAVNYLSASGGDWGITPTQWQYSTYPPELQSRMSVVHEGVDTNAIRPNPEAVFTTESGKQLRAGQKVVTYVARNLEPYRGFHIFMRALPEIQKRHPDAEILIIGADGVSYGNKLPEGDSHKKRMLAEVSFNPETVHFTGRLNTPEFRAAMHVSAAHVYLTYPFVLSWSLLEAMASGCLIIGSRTAPVQEVITDRQNGLLVDFFDRAALVDHIDEALSEPGKFADLRQAARRTVVAKYDLHSVCLPRQLGLVDSLMRDR